MLAKPSTNMKPEMTKALVLAILMVCSSLSVYLTSQIEQKSLEDAMKVSRSSTASRAMFHNLGLTSQ